MMTTEQTQVLVVGGALTGLSAAVFLAHRGVGVTLVERHPDLLVHPRLRGITPRTVEVLEQVGLGPGIRERSFVAEGTEWLPVRAETLSGEYVPVEEGGEPFIDPRSYSSAGQAGIDQDQLEMLLRHRASELAAELRFNTEMTSFTQDEAGVTATVLERAGGSESTIRAEYLIAADGSKSPIREALGIECDGPGVLFDTLTAMVDADLTAAVRGRSIGIAYLQKPRLFSSMMPHDSSGTRWLFSTGYDRTREAIEDFTPERVADMVRAASGLDDVAVSLRPQIPGTDIKVLAFPFGAQVARAYQSGRVFLAGDAARIQPPTGGFGGSTGIQDVHNLAWKLAAVLSGWADPTLLDTYETERLPYGRLAMEQAFARFGERMAEGAQIPIRQYASVTMGFRYASTATPGNNEGNDPIPVADLHAQPGTRAPHRVTLDGGTTLNLYGETFVLLAGHDGTAWTAAATAAGNALGVEVRPYRFGTDIQLADTESPEAAHGITPDGAVLIRPDGFVAWRSQSSTTNPTATLTKVLTSTLGRAA